MLGSLFSVSLTAFITGMYAGFLHYPLKMYWNTISNSASANGLLTISSMPGELKFFFIHYLENLNLPFIKCGIKKKLLIFLDFLITVVTFGFYYFKITDLTFFIIYLGVFALFASLRESISTGYKMEIYTKETIGEVTGVISWAYNLGLYIGGGLLTLFVTKWGIGSFQFNAMSWIDIFYYSSIFFGFNTILDCFIENSKEYEVEKIESESNVSQYLITFISLGLVFYICRSILLISLKYTMILFLLVSFMLFYSIILRNKKSAKIYEDLLILDKKQLFYLLGFLLTYKIAARLIMSVTVPFFRDFNLDMFAFKTISSLVIFSNVILVPLCVKLFNKRNLRLFSLFMYLIPVVLFCVCFYFKLYSYLFYVSVLERIARGFLEDIFFLAKADICGSKNAMAQLTILSCVEKIFSNVVSIGSGYLVDLLSWNALFIVAFFSMLPSLFFAASLEKVTIHN